MNINKCYLDHCLAILGNLFRQQSGIKRCRLESPGVPRGGLLEFFVLVIFSPGSHIHQSQTEEGVEDGGALSHTFLASARLKHLLMLLMVQKSGGHGLIWQISISGIIYKDLYILPVPCLDFRGYLKLIFSGLKMNEYPLKRDHFKRNASSLPTILFQRLSYLYASSDWNPTYYT